MRNVQKYLFHAFNQIFFPLFFVLFFVSSVILFIKVAGLTSIIQVSFLELTKLYLYSMPAVLFFTIPVAFFAAAVVAFAKLSYDYELAVLFSLGLNPIKIAKFFFYLSILASTLLLVLSLALVPLSKELYADFLEYKKNSANINIRASEFGQKFGDWMLYIDESSGEKYKNVVMFSKDAFEKEVFIVANEAQIVADGEIKLELEGGKSFLEGERSIEQIDFEHMELRDSYFDDREPFKGLFEHWSIGFLGDAKRAKEFSISVLTSIFPPVSIYLILVFGILNPRYQKNRSYIYILLVCGLYYALAFYGSIYIPFISLAALPAAWILASYLLYRRRIARYY